MNTKEISDKLNNSRYPFEPDRELMRKAKENGLVVVFGSSDDLMEFRGAIYDELGAWDGATAYVNKNGIFEGTDCEKCLERRDKEYMKIEQVWGGLDGYSWNYKTDVPHETFEILDGDENYCRGIVFSIDDL